MKKENKSTETAKQKKIGFFKTAFHEFNSSFKNMLKFPSFLLIIIYPILFFAVSWVLLYIWGGLTEKFIASVNSGAPANLAGATQAQLEFLSANLPKLYVYFIASGIILALLLVITWAVFEGLAWLQIMQKKKTIAYFWKFILLNIIWAIIFGIIFAAGLMLLSNNYTYFVIFVAALFILWLYFTITLYTLFTQDAKPRVFASLKRLFKTVASNGHVILFHFLLATLVFIAINILMFLITLIPNFPEIAYIILSAVLLLVFFAWMQFYMISIVKKEIE